MTISRNDIDTVRKTNGDDTTLGEPPSETSDGEIPYGMTLVGAINQLDEIGAHMDEYGLTYSDLSSEKQGEFDRAHEALQHYIRLLSNVLADGFVSKDDSIELPNGKTVDLPKAKTSGSTSKPLPEISN